MTFKNKTGLERKAWDAVTDVFQSNAHFIRLPLKAQSVFDQHAECLTFLLSFLLFLVPSMALLEDCQSGTD